MEKNGKSDYPPKMDLVVNTRRLLSEARLNLNIESAFLGLCDEICKEIERLGPSIKPFDASCIERFRSLDTTQKSAAIDGLSSYLKICVDAVERGVELKDSPSLLWHAIKSLNLVPQSDLFSQIESGDIIEIYSPDFKQAFRNFEFFKISSYPFSYMYLYQWNELYERADEITNHIASYGIDLFSGKTRQTVHSLVPTHILSEKLSPGRLRLKMTQKIFSPLYRLDGSVGGVVATSQVQIL